MKMSELVKRTEVPKETIHYYIREGLLRKPRKAGVNAAEYTEKHVEKLHVIKNLRDNYYLPIPIIKKIIKQSGTDDPFSRLYSKYFRPVDRLLTKEIVGREAFCEATGLGMKWLERAEAWGVITGSQRKGETVYSIDDVAIAKLMVDMERIGFGPKDGYDPEDLKAVADFVRKFVSTTYEKYCQTDLEKMSSISFSESGNQFHEMISLFFYHLYRKFARDTFHRLANPDNTTQK